MFAHTLVTIVSAASLQAATPDLSADLVALSQRLHMQAQARAQDMARSPAAPVEALPPQDSFLIDLSEFALEAHRLSRAVDDSGGPMDLRCIFRGMSEDAEHRAALLSEPATRADHARVYQEVARLTGQAAEIAATPDAQAAALSISCPAETDAQ